VDRLQFLIFLGSGHPGLGLMKIYGNQKSYTFLKTKVFLIGACVLATKEGMFLISRKDITLQEAKDRLVSIIITDLFGLERQHEEKYAGIPIKYSFSVCLGGCLLVREQSLATANEQQYSGL
jgi:hypothetical protein